MSWKGEGCIVCSLQADRSAKADPVSEDAATVSHIAAGAVLVAVGPEAFANAMVTACSKHGPMFMSALGQLAALNQLPRARQLQVLGCAVFFEAPPARNFDA